MDEAWWIQQPNKIGEFQSALRDHAPGLRLLPGTDRLIARGTYELRSHGAVLDRYPVELLFDPSCSSIPPHVWETGGHIPRIKNFHVNPADGTCCLGVYDEWIARTGDTSFAGFLQGPFRNFFLSQTYYRAHGVWPFDDRSHGLPGMIEAYAELVECPADVQAVGRLLAFLSIGEQKGHWQCPCGSGSMLRRCCGERMRALGSRIDAKLARKLTANLQRQIDLENAVQPGIGFAPGYTKY